VKKKKTITSIDNGWGCLSSTCLKPSYLAVVLEDMIDEPPSDSSKLKGFAREKPTINQGKSNCRSA